MHRVVKVTALEEFCLDLVFEDGTRGKVNLDHLTGRGVFELWSDYAEFRKVTIGETGELTWGDRVDLCPDALYLRVTGRKPEEEFPKLKQQLAHA